MNPLITPGLLRHLRPDLDERSAVLTAQKLQQACERFGIIQGEDARSRNRVAHVLSQIAKESGFRPIQENLNYSAQGLCRTWPSRFTPALAARCAFNPQAIANIAYANRMGNAGPDSGHGFAYRGRGILQLTGRANYETYARVTGFPLLGQPDLLLQIGVSCQVAAAYFVTHRGAMNGRLVSGLVLADAGGLRMVEAMTRFVNGGTHGLPERRAYFIRAAKWLGVL